MQVNSSDVPSDRLISPFKDMVGHHTDAYFADIAQEISLPELIQAFYTSPLFKAERLVLRLAARAPSSDADAAALAAGSSQHFAVWTVEARSDTDILLADKGGRTKSWLAVEPLESGTRVWFGSVVVPVMKAGKAELGPVFTSLMGVHALYSRALLGVAARRVTHHAA